MKDVKFGHLTLIYESGPPSLPPLSSFTLTLFSFLLFSL